LALALLAAASSGCGKDSPRLVPAGGLILYQDRPVAGVLVYFEPEHAEGNTAGYIARGVTGGDGSFTLQTHPYGKGAMPGSYRIYFPANSGLPGQYGDFDPTPLRAVVPAEGKADLMINLTE